jgi:PPOX class probable F420-dependent enzyme
MSTPPPPYTDAQWQFLRTHIWAILATGRRDGSPQQSMIGYAIDEQGRLVVSAKSYTAKWHNALRNNRVSLCVADGRAHLVVYGTVETFAADPERAELTADVFAALGGAERPDPTTLTELLDAQQRTVLRLTPERVEFHE